MNSHLFFFVLGGGLIFSSSFYFCVYVVVNYVSYQQ